MKETSSFSDHYSAAQFRTEAWNDLKHRSEKLQRDSERGVDVAELREAMLGTLALLDKLEHYWAFPGRKACAELMQLLERGFYRALARQTARVVRLLVSDHYRRGDVSGIWNESFEQSQGEQAEQERAASVPTREHRPYFEVLIVDDLSPGEVKELRRNLLEMRRDDDEFICDIVVVPSFDDAIIAVLFNHNIQSCVLRYRFPVETRIPIPELSHYLRMIDYDEVAARAQTDPCATLGQAIRQRASNKCSATRPMPAPTPRGARTSRRRIRTRKPRGSIASCCPIRRRRAFGSTPHIRRIKRSPRCAKAR